MEHQKRFGQFAQKRFEYTNNLLNDPKGKIQTVKLNVKELAKGKNIYKDGAVKKNKINIIEEEEMFSSMSENLKLKQNDNLIANKETFGQP